jgi:large subunit ribosomal protein L1
MKKGKKYVEASKLVEKGKLYDVNEAVELAKKTATTKFDGTVEIAINLNIDTKKADQQMRGSVVLPNGTGKSQRVCVIAKGSQAEAAKEAGAEFVGGEELVDKIAKENWLDFDVIIATPEMMPLLGKIGKVLGPRGLMPNPKTGTVTTDTVKAIEDVKKGRIEYRTDSYGNVHTII